MVDVQAAEQRRDVVGMAGRAVSDAPPARPGAQGESTPGSPQSRLGALLGRLRARHPILAQLVRFAMVSGFSTAINAAVFLTARIWWDTIPANLLALVVSTAIGTEVNRRFTFEAERTHRWRAHVQTGGTVLFYAFYSSAVLLLLGSVIDDPTPVQESIAVSVTSVLSGLGRFLLLRNWVFEPGRRAARRRARSEGRTAA